MQQGLDRNRQKVGDILGYKYKIASIYYWEFVNEVKQGTSPIAIGTRKKKSTKKETRYKN